MRADLEMCCGPDTWVNGTDTADVNSLDSLMMNQQTTSSFRRT